MVKYLVYNRMKITKLINKIKEPTYALLDSKRCKNMRGKKVFLDCGSNLGQGVSWFKKFFFGPDYNFELFEPNPSCWKYLEQICNENPEQFNLNKVGVGCADTKMKFYGLSVDEGGITSQGGSLLKHHNSVYYNAKDSNAVSVQLVDFKKILRSCSERYSCIIVKMDIEGYEIELLRDLVRNNCAHFINFLYVEFHSQYRKPDERKLIRRQEINIINELKDMTNMYIRTWH